MPAGSEVTTSLSREEPLTDAAETFEHLKIQADAEWHETLQQEHVLAAQLSVGARDFFYRSVDGRLGVIVIGIRYDTRARASGREGDVEPRLQRAPESRKTAAAHAGEVSGWDLWEAL